MARRRLVSGSGDEDAIVVLSLVEQRREGGETCSVFTETVRGFRLAMSALLRHRVGYVSPACDATGRTGTGCMVDRMVDRSDLD